ncbi:hypothetical protein LEP1GSC193_4027 [Leptospira alstonii serovar Pingchang str. 80-412]|uniref:Uncharacterized protein n=1 Tax=Leptospira alstonii serovar Pingchang str. 80-412 TaxID=1218564 RepID=T0H4I2_9LEPT|nr:hypothetical protein LEP1GSC193_4027 [Leptospira alstonii serovar Pingchang str. 80-412]
MLFSFMNAWDICFRDLLFVCMFSLVTVFVFSIFVFKGRFIRGFKRLSQKLEGNLQEFPQILSP